MTQSTDPRAGAELLADTLGWKIATENSYQVGSERHVLLSDMARAINAALTRVPQPAAEGGAERVRDAATNWVGATRANADFSEVMTAYERFEAALAALAALLRRLDAERGELREQVSTACKHVDRLHAEIATLRAALAAGDVPQGYVAVSREDIAVLVKEIEQHTDIETLSRVYSDQMQDWSKQLRAMLSAAAPPPAARAVAEAIARDAGYLEGLTMALTIAQQRSGGQAFKRGAALRIAEEIEAKIGAFQPRARAAQRSADTQEG